MCCLFCATYLQSPNDCQHTTNRKLDQLPYYPQEEPALTSTAAPESFGLESEKLTQAFFSIITVTPASLVLLLGLSSKYDRKKMTWKRHGEMPPPPPLRRTTSTKTRSEGEKKTARVDFNLWCHNLPSFHFFPLLQVSKSEASG